MSGKAIKKELANSSKEGKMTKLEFLCTLEKHIKPLPKEERESAIEYYSSYIDEMPQENIEEEIAKLGNPKHIASRLIAEFGISEMQRPSYQMVQSNQDKEVESSNKKSKVSVWTLIFAVLSAPITIPFAIAFVAILLALVIVLGSLVFAMFAVVFAIGISGVSVAVFAVANMAGNVGAGLIMLGVGLILFALAILLCMVAEKLTILIYRMFKTIISKIVQRRYNSNEKE